MPRLATALGVGEELVTDDLELATLGLSSLEVMEMVYDAEDELDIVVDEDSLADVTNDRRAHGRARHRRQAVSARVTVATSASCSRRARPSSARSRCSASSTRAPTGASPTSSAGPGGSRRSSRRCAPGARVGILAEDRAAFCDAFFGAARTRRGPGAARRRRAPSAPTRGARSLRDRVARFGLVGGRSPTPGAVDDARRRARADAGRRRRRRARRPGRGARRSRRTRSCSRRRARPATRRAW